MRQRIASALVITVLLTSCATTTPQTTSKPKPTNVKEWIAQNRSHGKMVAGAIIGGLLGAASGIVQGKQGDEVLARAFVGATAGAAIGFAIGRHQDKVYAGRDVAIDYAKYDVSQGYVARVERVAFDPAMPKPGQVAKLSIRYVVLGPNPNETLTVRVFRGLKYGDDYVFGAGPNEFRVPKGGGIVDSTVELTLPAKAPVGSYKAEALLEDANGKFAQAVGTAPVFIVASAAQRSGVASAAR